MIQTILTLSALATVTIFTLSFLADFTATLRQAWRAAAPADPILQPEPEAAPQLKFASLDWVQPHSAQEIAEEIDVVALAKARLPMPKPHPTIVTLPQTPEAEQLEKWLSVPQSPVSTPRPDYTKLTFKQLRQEAKVRNVRNSGSMVKADLIAAILAA